MATLSAGDAAKPLGSNVVADGNLVSRQKPASSKALADKAVELLHT